MDWKKWFKYSPYKKLWSLLGGRPWTYITRDLYHKGEYIWLVGLFTGGFLLGRSGLVSMKWYVILITSYTIGFIHGHFFWGTKYKENQEGE